MVQLFNTKSLFKLTKLIMLVVIASIFIVPTSFAHTWDGADLSKEERKAKIQEVYASKPKITMSKEVEAILNKDLKFGGGKARRNKAKRELNRLIEAGSDYYKAKRGIRFGDSNAEDYFQDIKDALDDFVEDGIWTEEEMRIVINEVERIHEQVISRVEEASKYEKKDRVARRVQEEVASEREDVKEELAEWRGAVACPNSTELRAKYTSGCWSCLVLERLISAFLHAANKGLPIVQKAGITLLWIGFAFWISMWALKNVSSFTEIQIGNILNDLIKGLFKIAIAYWFIYNSTTAISQYFITPMLSVGATIGQQFWPAEFDQYVEKWDGMTDADIAEFEKELQKPTEEIQTPVPTEDSQVEELSEAEKENNAEASAKNDKIFGETEIPNLLIPGLTGGKLTSSYGCRPRPCETCSKSHMGIDLAVAGSDSKCNPIIAAGPGTITYNTGGNGGYRAIIDHGTIKGNVWKTYYLHMKNNSGSAVGSVKKIKQGEFVGCIGNTGVGTGAHLHFGVYFSGTVNGQKIETYVDPLSLPAGKICYINKDTCDGVNRKNCAESMCKMGESIRSGGYPAAGNAVAMLSFNTPSVLGSGSESIVVEIPEVKYTGPTNIMPKSVMNSILGATRAITNTTAEMMVLGNAVTCYAGDANGGAWRIFGFDIVNIFMWLSGAIVWGLGFMLTLAIAYYLLDISFKIGFAVLSIPVLMGLWPYGFTQGKIYIAVSIIAKASATFAFLALTTAFGMAMLSEALGNIEILYNVYDSLTLNATGDKGDGLKDYISSQVMPFSSTFLLACFTMLYFYKLVEQTISDLVNKFFPDKAFGDSSPMHSAATMMTSWAKNLATKATGLDLAKDIVANQAGNLVKGGLKATGRVATALPKAVATGTTTAAYKGIKRAVKSGSLGNGARVWAHEMKKTDVGKVVAGGVKVGSKVVSKAKQLKRDHGGVLKGAWAETAQATKNAYKNIGRGVKHAAKTVKQAPKKAWTAVKQAPRKVWTAAVGGVKKTGRAIGRAIATPFKAVGNAFKVVKKRYKARRSYKKNS